MASDEGDDDFIAQEIANVETVLSLQSNPLKESAEAAALSGTGLASSSKVRVCCGVCGACGCGCTPKSAYTLRIRLFANNPKSSTRSRSLPLGCHLP